MRRLGLALAFLSLGAQERPLRTEYPSDGVYWESSGRIARSESTGRGSPILLALLQEGDESKAMAENVLNHRKFIDASRDWVSVIAHPGTKHQVDIERNGKRVSVCDLYWNITCDVHDKALREVGVKELPEMRPALLYLDDKGNEIGRLIKPVSAGDVVRAQESLLKTYDGFKTPIKEWRAAKEREAEAEGFVKEDEWQKAIKAFKRLQDSPLRAVEALGEKGMAGIIREGEKRLNEALRLTTNTKDTFKMAEGKKRLRQIIVDFKPLDCSRRAQETMDWLKKNGH